MPGSIARKLALPKLDREEFTLADGTRRAYDGGEAFFELDDRRGASKVVFGPSNVTPPLGALTLDSLGMTLNARDPTDACSSLPRRVYRPTVDLAKRMEFLEATTEPIRPLNDSRAPSPQYCLQS